VPQNYESDNWAYVVPTNVWDKMIGLSVPEPRTDDQTPVAQSVCRAITSAAVAMLAESNFAQIDGFDDFIELRGIVAGESLPSIVAVVC